jgi:rubrerythrin
MPTDLITALEDRRAAEKEQSLFYRGLAAEAETAGDGPLAGRLHDLHADEQHHLSRLTARILELGGRPRAMTTGIRTPPLDAWEAEARLREGHEVAAYRALLQRSLDPTTEALLRQILETEERHEEGLSGKWMPA